MYMPILNISSFQPPIVDAETGGAKRGKTQVSLIAWVDSKKVKGCGYRNIPLYGTCLLQEISGNFYWNGEDSRPSILSKIQY